MPDQIAQIIDPEAFRTAEQWQACNHTPRGARHKVEAMASRRERARAKAAEILRAWPVAPALKEAIGWARILPDLSTDDVNMIADWTEALREGGVE